MEIFLWVLAGLIALFIGYKLAKPKKEEDVTFIWDEEDDWDISGWDDDCDCDECVGQDLVVLYENRFDVGDKVRNIETGEEGVVELLPGMEEYDKVPYLNAEAGMVLSKVGWRFQDEYELAPKKKTTKAKKKVAKKKVSKKKKSR